jgi:hypothetical protein
VVPNPNNEFSQNTNNQLKQVNPDHDDDEKQRKRKNIERKNIMKIRDQRLWRTQQILPQSQLQL